MIKNKKLAKNFIWNTLGSTLVSFNSLFFLIIITRMNGMTEAGIFTITYATSSIFYIIATYSGRNCQITDVKGHINDREYMVTRMINCTVMALLVVIYCMVNGYDAHKNTILILLCIWRGFEAFSDVLYGVMQKKDELYKVGISQIARGILGIVAFLLVDYITKNVVLSCICLCMASMIVFFCYDLPQAIKLLPPKVKIQKENIKTIYQKEFFIFANGFLVMYLLNAPKYAIENYLTEDIQAVFGIILMPASILPLFAQFVVAPLVNQLTNLYKEHNIVHMKKIERKSMYAIIGFGILACLIGYTVGIPVLNLIYNVDLAPYRIDFMLILFAYIFYAMGYVETMILTIYRKMKEQFYVYVMACITICLESYYFVNKIGVKGASISYVITMILYCALLMGITYYQTKKEKKKIG